MIMLRACRRSPCIVLQLGYPPPNLCLSEGTASSARAASCDRCSNRHIFSTFFPLNLEVIKEGIVTDREPSGNNPRFVVRDNEACWSTYYLGMFEEWILIRTRYLLIILDY